MLRGLTGRIVAAGLILLLLVGGSFAGLFLAINELRSADAQVSRSATELQSASTLLETSLWMLSGTVADTQDNSPIVGATVPVAPPTYLLRPGPSPRPAGPPAPGSGKPRSCPVRAASWLS